MSIEGVFRRQAGVISRSQALAEGMSASTVSRRVSSGTWIQLHPKVFLAADHDLTNEARLRAAVLWAGLGASVSGVAAAWWHGLWPSPPAVVEVTVPLRRLSRPTRGTRLRHRDLQPVDLVQVRGLWTTAVPLTVLEAAVALGEAGSRLVDRALQQRVEFDALHRAHCRNLGRRGSAAAGQLLVAAADRAASAAERQLVTLLSSAHITGWQLHYLFGGYELDLAFPDHRVAVEVDGWAWHHDVKAFRHDRQRQNSLVLAGWTVLRFTWHDLTHRAGHVVADIRTIS